MTPTQNNGGRKGAPPRRNGQGIPGKGQRTVPARPQNRPVPMQNRQPRPGQSQRRRKPAPPPTLGQALAAELKDILQKLWYYIYENVESILKGIVCGLYLVLLLMLQTTFFVEFAPFGAVPDLLLSLTVAIAVSEGEKWGAVFGLIAASLSHIAGGAPGPVLLPLLYMPAGYFCGICAKEYLSDSIPVRGIYIAVSGAGRGIITAISAACILTANPAEIFLDIVVPEFFSTALMAPGIYGLIYLSMKPFHKSRAERTEN